MLIQHAFVRVTPSSSPCSVRHSVLFIAGVPPEASLPNIKGYLSPSLHDPMLLSTLGFFCFFFARLRHVSESYSCFKVSPSALGKHIPPFLIKINLLRVDISQPSGTWLWRKIQRYGGWISSGGIKQEGRDDGVIVLGRVGGDGVGEL